MASAGERGAARIRTGDGGFAIRRPDNRTPILITTCETMAPTWGQKWGQQPRTSRPLPPIWRPLSTHGPRFPRPSKLASWRWSRPLAGRRSENHSDTRDGSGSRWFPTTAQLVLPRGDSSVCCQRTRAARACLGARPTHLERAMARETPQDPWSAGSVAIGPGSLRASKAASKDHAAGRRSIGQGRCRS